MLCNDGVMAKTVIVKLTDDIDGGDADETISFALDGRYYEIDLSSENAARLRHAFKPFTQKARARGGPAARTGANRHDVLTPQGRREGAVPCLGQYGDGPSDQR